ncbi:MAG: GTPase Era [Acidobacteria bacterium]|uniref:GTPase Era n=1 Tax=Candidatus Polarisedimenticola svalbardensis TaxID=2886004 RepID=A0A8J6XXR1_9BACT|nr:GTPase Era [Candidatus Polarisedimenticola svalbardensis]
MKSGAVGIIGWTNVGKSTLLNRLIGEKVAAVSNVPQTTRNRITGVLNVAGEGQIVFMDTPGLHKPKFRMNRAMVEIARGTLGGVDAVILMVDGDRGLGPGDRQAAALLEHVDVPKLVAVNKVDRIKPKTRLFPLLQTVVNDLGFPAAIPISALRGDGCDLLVEEILKVLPEGEPLFPEDYLTDQPERTLAAEYVREKILRRTRQEIPHAVAVLIGSWEERDGFVYVDATILVERESQKAIVIGKGGELLKQVGTESRLELEALLGVRMHLTLWVKVRKDWRNDRSTLHEIGLS